MNKRTAPKDLLSNVTTAEPPADLAAAEPTPAERRNLHVNGMASYLENVEGQDQAKALERAEQITEDAVAAGKITLVAPDPHAEAQPHIDAALAKIRAAEPKPDFDWLETDAVVLHEQPETAIYFNPNGALVIRQRADWNEENDPFVFICPNNIADFIDKLCDVVGIPGAGRR